ARRPARLLLVARAGLASDPRAHLRHVALARRRPADEGARPHHVARAGGAAAGAGLVGIAQVTRALAADRGGVAGRELTGVGRAVAGVGRARVAVVGARRAARLFLVRRARLAGDAGTLLVEVALARRRPADKRARLRRGGRTGRARAGAGLGR